MGTRTRASDEFSGFFALRGNYGILWKMDFVMKTYKIITSALCAAAVLVSLPSAGAAEAKADVRPYPLSKCLISGEKLGGMGKPVVMVNGQQEVKFCCNGCVADYKKDPAAFMKKLDAAAQQAAKEHPYKLTTCLVSDEKLDGAMGKPFVFVYNDKEIKLCCGSCLADFKKDPEKFLKKLEPAKEAK